MSTSGGFGGSALPPLEGDSLLGQDEVDGMVEEYLSRCGMVATAECFRKERPGVGRERQGGNWWSPAKREGERGGGARKEENLVRILKAFDEGDHTELFVFWHDLLPSEVRSRREALRLEFMLNVHIAILPFTDEAMLRYSSVDEASRACARSMSVFKRYLETRGQKLCSETEFMNYFALPYVPDPAEHPNYAELFEPDWREKLRLDLRNMIRDCAEDSGSMGVGEQERPRLVQALIRSEAEKVELQSLYRELQVIIACLQGVDDTEIQAASSAAQMRLNALLGRDNREEGEAKEEQVRGEGARRGSLSPAPEAEEKNGFEEDEKHQHTPREMAITPPPSPPLREEDDVLLKGPVFSPPHSPVRRNRDLHKSSSRTILPPLDYAEMRAELQRLIELVVSPPKPANTDPIPHTPTGISCALLLQALRWRFASATPGKIRRGILYHYIRHDILGIQANVTDGVPRRACLLSMLLKARRHDGQYDLHCALIVEYTARLLNALATMSRARTYLLSGGDSIPIVELMLNVMKREEGDSAIRKNLLGCIQKMSLRTAAQTIMIQSGGIEYFTELLDDHVNGSRIISAYSLEYLTALLMNFSARPSGRDEIERHTSKLLPALMGLLGSPNPIVHEYVNSILYMCLQRDSVRRKASEIGMEDMIAAILADSRDADPSLRRQLKYVLERLQNGLPPGAAEDGSELDQDLEIQEDEEDAASPDEMAESEELMRYANTRPSGERLLASTFGLSSVRAHELLQQEREESGPDYAPKSPAEDKLGSLPVPSMYSSFGSEVELDGEISEHILEKSFDELTEAEIKALDETREAFRKKERLIRTPQHSQHGPLSSSPPFFDGGY